MKRLFAAMLSLWLLLGVVGTFVMPASAANEETILIAGSDFQTSGNKTDKVSQVISTLKANGFTKVDGAFFCGDYTPEKWESNQSQYGIQKLKDTFADLAGDKMWFVQGNHDIDTTTGLSKSGDNDPISREYGLYIIHEDEYPQYNWDNSRELVEETAANLEKYLNAKVKAGWKKPIFVLSHVGLHWGNRTVKEGSAIYGKYLVDVLNEAGKKGLNIIFLYGHDHSEGFADFLGGGAIYFKKGDQIEVCTGEKKERQSCTLNFTYMNAGYIGGYSTDEATTDATVTMSVFRIQSDNSVIITRYDGVGVHNLKSAGVWHAKWSDESTYATPNTLVYPSSRRVTATEDVQVDTPAPPVMETTAADSAYTTTQNGGVVINKHTNSTQAGDTPTTVQDATATVADETADTTKADKNTAKDADAAPKDTASAPLIPWWAWLGMSVVAVLLIGAVIAIVLLSRPVKP